MEKKMFKITDQTTGAEIITASLDKIEEWLNKNFLIELDWVKESVEDLMYTLRGGRDRTELRGYAGDALNVTWEMV